MTERIAPIIATPTFCEHTCPKCGTVHTITNKPPPQELCWDCRTKTLGENNTDERAEQLEASIPELFKWSRFADVKRMYSFGIPPSAMGTAQKSTNEPLVCLHGPANGGKTTLGVAMLREAQATTKRSAMFVTANQLAVARGMHSLGDGEALLIERCQRAHYLLIDGLGEELSAGPSRGEVGTVVMERHNQAKPIWFTTWLDPAAIEAKYGEGIARRLLAKAKIIRVVP